MSISFAILMSRVLLCVSAGGCVVWALRPETGMEPWIGFITALGALAATFGKDRYPALAVRIHHIVTSTDAQWAYLILRNNGDAPAYDVEMTVTTDDRRRPSLHNRQVISSQTSEGIFPRASIEPGEQLEIEFPRGDRSLLTPQLRFLVKLEWKSSSGTKSIQRREFHTTLSQYDTAIQAAQRK